MSTMSLSTITPATGQAPVMAGPHTPGIFFSKSILIQLKYHFRRQDDTFKPSPKLEAATKTLI